MIRATTKSTKVGSKTTTSLASLASISQETFILAFVLLACTSPSLHAVFLTLLSCGVWLSLCSIASSLRRFCVGQETLVFAFVLLAYRCPLLHATLFTLILAQGLVAWNCCLVHQEVPDQLESKQ